MRKSLAPPPKARKSSIVKSKPTSGQEQRKSHVQNTLRQIREKRLSFNATTKGVFSDRTPSRPLSPVEVSAKKDTELLKDRPTLSLTKLDFELLRGWDWKERQKRLESWGKDLGITKTHSHFKRPDRRVDDGTFKKRAGHGKRAKAQANQATSGVILKKELEHLTGLRVYAPGQASIAPSNRTSRKKSILKNSFLPSIPPTVSKRASDSGSVEQQKHHHHHHHHEPSVKDHGHPLSVQQEIRRTKFDNLIKQATQILETKSTFGKTWEGAPAAPQKEKAKRPSLIRSEDTRKTETTLGSGSSEETLRSRRTTSHGHHHRHQSHSRSRHSSAYHVHSSSQQSSRIHTHPYHSRHRTDIEEEQPSTDYTSSRISTRGAAVEDVESIMTMTRQRSSSPSTPSDSANSIGLNDLFRGLRKSLDDDKSDEGGDDEQKSDKPVEKYQRPNQPVEYQDTCFGGIRFVDRSAVKPVAKVNKDFEFYMTFDDTQLGLGMGRAQSLKVKFFKPASTGGGRSKKVLERKAAEKAVKARVKEEHKRQKMAAAANAAEGGAGEQAQPQNKMTLKSFSELPAAGLLQFSKDSGKTRMERLMEFEKALMELPGISSRWNVEVTPASRRASHDANMVGRIPKRSQFTRPPRRIWYTPLPLTIKKYYRTNWKKIRFDMRKLMKDQQFWPRLWINFEESHPKKLFELVQAKLAVKDFDKYGFKRVFDWGRGIHPDYIDWILEDIVPHPGRYYYKEDDGEETEAVRRASVEESDFRLKEWFVKPPRYIPDTPLSPPFDHYDFCGYGNREKPFFLAFTLPREILHYYAPPSHIQKFFRNIPKPPYAFPGYTFKRWLNYPLEQKLPQYYPFPQRFMTWTKGKIGESVQCNSKNFYIDDPLIVKRDIEYSPYHDAHTRGYILRKDILDRLWELGIINSKGEVKCSMSEFNKNRMYLRNYEWLEEVLRRWNLQWNDRQVQNRLTKNTNFDDHDWEAKKKRWFIKLEKCKKNAEIRDAEDRKRFQNIVERTKRTVQEAERRKQMFRQQIVERARKKHDAQIRRKEAFFLMQHARKLQLQRISDKKDLRAARHRKHHFLEQVADRLEKQKETWDRHVEFHKMKVNYVKRLEMELENEYKMRVQQHKKKVRAQRRDIPYAIIRKREHENRANYLALKYGRIWLAKVRERMKNLPDEAHISMWTNGRHLDSTVEYLKDASGYIHIDTLFFSAFRKALEDQIELEEKEEREKQERPKTRKTGKDGQSEDESQEDDKSDKNYLASGEDSDESEDDKDENNMDGYEADEDEDAR